MNILLVEDNKQDYDLMTERLNHIIKDEESQVFIDKATSLKEAINLFTSNKYDIMFLDLNLPDSDGENTIKEVVNCVNKNPELRSTDIVVLTGLQDYSLARKAMEIGIKEFLLKDEMNTKYIRRTLQFASLKQSLPNKKNHP